MKDERCQGKKKGGDIDSRDIGYVNVDRQIYICMSTEVDPEDL
jgi:hypothetical protein